MKRWLIILTLLTSFDAIASLESHEIFKQKLFEYVALQVPEIANQIVSAFMCQIDEIDQEDYEEFIQDQSAIRLAIDYIDEILKITSIQFFSGYSGVFFVGE